MTTTIGSEADLTAVGSGLLVSRSDVGRSRAHLEGGARNGVRDATHQISRGLRGLSHSAAAKRERTLETVGARAEERPLLVSRIALDIRSCWRPRDSAVNESL